MPLLIFAAIALVIALLVIMAIDQLPITSPFVGIIKFLIIIIAAVLIAQKAGVI
jgi:hypothetical protein